MNDRMKRERAETDALKREALEFGIEIPGNSSWWWDDFDNFGGSPHDWELVSEEFTYLTEVGKAGVRRLIRDERRKETEWERKGTQWKLTIAGVIIGWLLGIAGILIAIFRE